MVLTLIPVHLNLKHKNLLVHEWKHLKRSTKTCVDTLSCFTLDLENGKFVINMVSHRPEPTRQPYTCFPTQTIW